MNLRCVLLPTKRDAGVALIFALYFLVVVGVLVAGAFYSVTWSQHASDFRIDDTSLTAAADFAATDALAGWVPEQREAQAIRSTSSPVAIAGTRAISARVSVTRLSWSLFWLVGEARRADRYQGVHRVNLIVRLPLARPAIAAALVSAGDVSLEPGVTITSSPDPRCGLARGVLGGIVVAPGARVVAAGRDSTHLPAVGHAAVAADSSTYEDFGAAGWSWLAGAAAEQVDPGATIRLQGDSVLPHTIHARGDLTVQGGHGRGILLVEGRLQLTGPLVFDGLIVAKQGIETLADSVRISGTVLSGALTVAGRPPPVLLRDGTELRSSICSLASAVVGRAMPRPVGARAWAELF